LVCPQAAPTGASPGDVTAGATRKAGKKTSDVPLGSIGMTSDHFG
jgi:hypothetical protein